MDVEFFNSGNNENGNQTPKPREEIKIEAVEVMPYRDGLRVQVSVEATPFRERPNLMLVIHDEDDNIVSELSIIETMHYNMEFTMHLRGVDSPVGAYALTVDLFYDTRNPPQDRRVEGFVVEQVSTEE